MLHHHATEVRDIVSQLEHLTRVKNNIGDLVEEFVNWRWSTNQPRFYMRSLHDFIFRRTNTAPASPDRILRQLRAQGKINYKVIDRKASCYLLIEGKYQVTQINLKDGSGR